MTLTPSQRRSWSRHGVREMQRTIDQAKADIAAQREARPLLQRVKTTVRSVDLNSIQPGDRIQLLTGAVLMVKRVNRASITAESGTRWTASEIVRVIPADGESNA